MCNYKNCIIDNSFHNCYHDNVTTEKTISGVIYDK